MKELGNNRVRFKNGIVAKRLKNGQLRILPSNQWGGYGRKQNKKHLNNIRKQVGGNQTLFDVIIDNRGNRHTIMNEMNRLMGTDDIDINYQNLD